MAIIVGTNSYLTLQEFKDNSDTFGFDYSSFTDPQIEQSLSKSALFYIDPKYDFKGVKISDTQAMDLPTDEVAITDIAFAATQLAFQSLQGKLFVDTSMLSANGNIVSERKKLSTLEKETTYEEGTSRSDFYDTSVADGLLKPYLKSSGGGGWACVKRQS